MHVLLLAEGYSDDTGLAKFEKDWHGKQYANGKAKLRVREMKLYTLAINEAGREEFLAELKYLTGGAQSGHGSDGRNGSANWQSLVKWVRRLSKLFGVKPIDDSKIVAKPVGVGAGESGWNCHFITIGEVKDNVNHLGTEQV